MILYVIDKYNTDPTHIYVTGGSSGAMMSHVRAATVLRRLFGGVDQWNNSCFGGQVKASADQLKKVVLGVYPSNGGPRPKMQVRHGNADSTLAPLNYQETIKQWTGVFDVSKFRRVNGRIPHRWGLPHSLAPSLSRLGICPSEKDGRTSSIDWLNALGFDAGFTILGKKPSIKAIQSLKDVMPVSFAVGFVAAAWNTTSSQTRKIERAPVPWVVVLFVCSTTLMALGIAGVYQSFQVRDSDVFDPMRGLTYDNPYMDLPSSGTMLHASARAQLSQNV
ncbi:hypothetical protein SCAR479_12788 [Seiridium cardinale]|uniref:Carboxylic ester hydrolase n=1 Tax=Seiridium cardinale TaxID=138064 RepID=A0ABR2X9T3_9PEZI